MNISVLDTWAGSRVKVKHWLDCSPTQVGPFHMCDITYELNKSNCFFFGGGMLLYNIKMWDNANLFDVTFCLNN